MKRKLVSRREGRSLSTSLLADVETWEQTSLEQTPLPKYAHNHETYRPDTNPAVAILRKIFWLVARDVRYLPKGNVFLDFIKDVAYGTLCGIVFVLFISFLDYRNIFSIRSSSRLRSSAYELITDPEWLKTIEENIDVRFVDIDIYNAIKNEIQRGKDARESGFKNREYQRTVKKLEAKRRELEKAEQEYDEELSKLGIDVQKFCGGCMASPHVRCGQRLKYVMENYGLPEKRVKANLMKEGMCFQAGSVYKGPLTKKFEANQGGMEMANEDGEEVSKLEVKMEKWCGGCMVSPWVRCGARLKFIMEKYGAAENEIKANLMKDGMCFLPDS